MLLDNKKVAIVGGGPAGLTLARLLQQSGVYVNVYERDLDKNARVQGAPLDLHDESGLAALRKANLLEKFKENYMVGADREKIMNPNGNVFFSDHEKNLTEDFGKEHFRPEIDRGVLRRILLDALETETVVWNSHFLSMEKQGAGWLLHFKNADTQYADLVIAADGANSKIRPYVTDIKAIYSGITMLEGNIADAKNNAPNIYEMLNGGKIMAFGNGQNILMGQKGKGEIGYYISFKTDENWHKTIGIDFTDKTQVSNWFQKAYATWNPMWYELFENVLLPFIPRPIYYMPFDQTWSSQSNVTMIGDAAHVMSPFAGEGVNMAMLDALELRECLLSETHSSLKQAIENFENKMRPRAATIAKKSLDNGELMHSENALESMIDFFSEVK
ncbi:FAD-dependent oxidoreductase [Rhizosphaericola mali]|uniref:Flavin-dependent monooxygenase n=1 Tax=Rhizosphaericola mali TaxID=2545455 RepID=A0A5P2G3M5_9BACT|nr:NAD(P)/FAD-dependent oxidoreductase [Rhizosphaericola mali]QES88422.1 FAD-dependent monooxygenase [Rhizosphaericola mali]